MVAILILAGLPRLSESPSLPRQAARPLATVVDAARRFYLLVVAAGLVLLMLWPRIQPYGWIAPLAIAAGLLPGQGRDAKGNRRAGLRRRAVPILAAGICLFWAVALAPSQLGRQDARERAGDVTRWTSAAGA